MATNPNTTIIGNKEYTLNIKLFNSFIFSLLSIYEDLELDFSTFYIKRKEKNKDSKNVFLFLGSFFSFKKILKLVLF